MPSFPITKKLAQLPYFLFHKGFTTPAVWLQKTFFAIDPKPVRLRGLNYFQNGKRLRAMRWDGMQDYPVFVINRAKDTERLKGFSESCRKWGAQFEHVEGVDLQKESGYLAKFKDRIGTMCYNSPNFVRGIYGCFLAHREAWLRVQSCGSEWAMVCEDDARFLGPLPVPLDSLSIPEGAEIIFSNVRMAGGILNRQSGANSSDGFEYVPVMQAVRENLEVCTEINAPGGDGYFLSRRGAEKLLRIFDEWTMDFDVDWFMMFQCLGKEDMEHFLRVDSTGRFTGYNPHSERLIGYVMSPSFVEQAAGESKVRRAEFCSREELFC